MHRSRKRHFSTTCDKQVNFATDFPLERGQENLHRCFEVDSVLGPRLKKFSLQILDCSSSAELEGGVFLKQWCSRNGFGTIIPRFSIHETAKETI